MAAAHVKAIDYLNRNAQYPPLVVNIGTGKGYSVLEMVKAYEKASGSPIPYQITARRSGDIAKCFANPAYAQSTLNWQATKGIDEMCADSYRWQKNNPDGYHDRSLQT